MPVSGQVSKTAAVVLLRDRSCVTAGNSAAKTDGRHGLSISSAQPVHGIESENQGNKPLAGGFDVQFIDQRPASQARLALVITSDAEEDGRLMPGDTISLNRLELLRFYDNPSASERGIHAAAVNAVAGEEFGLALVLDFLNASGVDASIIPGPCTTGSRKGHRLDGWVRTPDVLYQVEIKNWSAHSFGGTNLAINADPEELARYRTKLWGEYWSGSTFTDTAAQKVLEPMRPPASRPQVEPLIAFWPSMHPEGLATPLFQVPLIGGHFNRVSVFSMSSYLRGMDREHLELPLPKTMARLAILARMFEPVDAFRV